MRAAWLHLWQVRAIMSDWRKWQLLILSLWWGRGRERTPAELNCSHHTCWCCGHSPVIMCFQLSAYTLELIYTFKAFVGVPTYSFSFSPLQFPVQCHSCWWFTFEMKLWCHVALFLALFHFEMKQRSEKWAWLSLEFKKKKCGRSVYVIMIAK